MTVKVRAAFHVHSEWSHDAKLTLDELVALFRGGGYDAVFLCEHDRGFDADRHERFVTACDVASTPELVLVPGLEYADPEDRIHVPVWGAVPFLGERVPTEDLLEQVVAHDGLSVLAHPVRRDAWKVVDPAWLQLLTGIELWTRKWDGWAPNQFARDAIAGSDLLAIASLDLHVARQMFPLAMELEVEGAVTAASCVDAVRRRRCRPLVGRVPAEVLARGSLGAAVQAAERLRRPPARRARKLLDALGGDRG